MIKQLLAVISLLICCALPMAGMAQDLVRIASPSISLPHGALAMALVDSGIFENNDIGLIMRDTRGSATECLRALQGEEIEVCEVSTFSGLDAIAGGADLQVLAALTGPVSEIVFSTKATQSLGIGLKPPLHVKIDALAAARIATTAVGTTHYLTFAALLSAEGQGIENMRMQAYDSPDAMAAALRAGDADAMMWTTGEMAALVSDGTAVPWISLTRGDIMSMEKLPYVSAFARRDWIAAHPELASRIHKSYARANRLLRIDPSAAARLRAELAPDEEWSRWETMFRSFKNVYLRRASTTQRNWDRMVSMRQAATGKDYGAASFARVVIPAAQQ